MFNFSFLKCYQKKVIFYVSIFVVATNFILSQASAVADNSYKNKIYTNLYYMNIDSNIDIMLYGIGAEAKLPNSIEILCNYATGNVKLKKDVDTSFQDFQDVVKITSKKQKSADKSHLIDLTAKHYYNDFLFQANFVYILLADAFKVDISIGSFKALNSTINTDSNATCLAINLGKKFAINDNLYLLPKCSVGFSNSKVKKIIKGRNHTSNQIEEHTFVDATTSGVIITPELVIGGDLFLPTAIKINPEISFSYLFDTKYSSNNKLNINPKINMEINQFYVAIEADSITESDGRSFYIKLGVLF